MNVYWFLAGIFLIISGFVHAILGDKWLFNKLKAENLQTHYTGEITKITLRWFWHFGSFMIFLIGTTTLIMVFDDTIISDEHLVAKLFSIIYFGLTFLLILFNLQKLSNLKEFPQGLLILGIAVLLYLGAS